MWVARCDFFGDKNLSPSFKSIYDCQDYIEKNLQVLEFLLSQVQRFVDNKVDGKFVLRFGNYIRCYNVKQNRWCDGFDF